MLFNEIPSKPLNHDLEAALAKLAEIADIPFDIPEDVREFVKYLNEQGGNRYFEYPTYTEGEELLNLDRTVWHIRRYCYYMRTRLGSVDCFPRELKWVHSFGIDNAHKFRISRGYLEKVSKEKSNPLRAHLVWKNFYYGAKRKRTISNFRMYAGSSNPTLFLRPKAFPKLDALVKFSKPIRDYFKKGSPAP